MSGEYMFGTHGDGHPCSEYCRNCFQKGFFTARVQNIAGIAFKKDFSQQLRLMNSRKPLPSPDEKDMQTSLT